ncbi:hypothetical protein [uncultured Brevundimonas sp.]|uniref:hypothetical protein n=1 Tax=uncultured Brevundimonas sp. TaxID=213418 RepID=UPI0025D91C1B|nr:hypothetical protein [uncultured Brevundimonas sp.]
MKMDMIRLALGWLFCLTLTLVASITLQRNLSIAWVALMLFCGYLLVRVRPSGKTLIIMLLVTAMSLVMGFLALSYVSTIAHSGVLRP